MSVTTNSDVTDVVGGGDTFNNSTFTGAAGFADGTAAAPSIAWTSDIDGNGTGLYRSAANCINFTTNGTNRWIINSTGMLAPQADLAYQIGQSNLRALSVYARDVFGGTTKTLAESSATGLCDITIASNSRISGLLQYSIEADDGTEFQVRTGQIPFTAVSKAGTITANVGTAAETVSVSSGTLTVTITIPTGTGKVTLSANAVSSLTQTTLQAKWRLISPDNLAVTAL